MKKLLLVAVIALCGCKSPPEPQIVQTRYPESEYVFTNNDGRASVIVYKKSVEGGHLYISRTHDGVTSTFVPSK